MMKEIALVLKEKPILLTLIGSTLLTFSAYNVNIAVITRSYSEFILNYIIMILSFFQVITCLILVRTYEKIRFIRETVTILGGTGVIVSCTWLVLSLFGIGRGLIEP